MRAFAVLHRHGNHPCRDAALQHADAAPGERVLHALPDHHAHVQRALHQHDVRHGQRKDHHQHQGHGVADIGECRRAPRHVEDDHQEHRRHRRGAAPVQQFQTPPVVRLQAPVVVLMRNGDEKDADGRAEAGEKYRIAGMRNGQTRHQGIVQRSRQSGGQGHGQDVRRPERQHPFDPRQPAVDAPTLWEVDAEKQHRERPQRDAAFPQQRAGHSQNAAPAQGIDPARARHLAHAQQDAQHQPGPEIARPHGGDPEAEADRENGHENPGNGSVRPSRAVGDSGDPHACFGGAAAAFQGDVEQSADPFGVDSLGQIDFTARRAAVDGKDAVAGRDAGTPCGGVHALHRRPGIAERKRRLRIASGHQPDHVRGVGGLRAHGKRGHGRPQHVQGARGQSHRIFSSRFQRVFRIVPVICGAASGTL